MINIAFHLTTMSERGTEVSAYDYALYNEKLLGNNSIIIANRKKIFNQAERVFINLFKKMKIFDDNNIKIYSKRQRSTYEKFSNKFKIFFYDNRDEIDLICRENKVDYFYAQKPGYKDNIYTKYCKNLIHALYMYDEPHGHRYLYCSEWLSKKMTGKKEFYVPYIVNSNFSKTVGNLREKFNIPKDQIIIASHGGKTSFDVEFVKKVIKKVVSERNDLNFFFLNTEKFISHPKVFFFPRTIDPVKKFQFINSADYMIYARSRGETFGLAIAEFSICNKPVIAYANTPERAHLDMLGEKSINFSNENELYDILLKLNKSSISSIENYYDCYSKKFSPDIVMKMFKEKFLD